MPDTFVLAPQLEEIARLSAWSEGIAAGIALSASSRFALQLCLEEQVSNIIRHGGAATSIRVTLLATEDDLVATVEDEGPAFDPLAEEAVAPREIGGQGLRLLRSFVDRACYQRRGGVNRLVMCFRKGK